MERKSEYDRPELQGNERYLGDNRLNEDPAKYLNNDELPKMDEESEQRD